LSSFQLQTKTLFAFDDADSTSWSAVNDDVMGGVSKARMKIDFESGTGTFEGALSLKNNGGFSTVRSKSSNLTLAGHKGLILRVKGDGRTYRIQALGESSRWQMRIYQTEFKTKKGEWMEFSVPFAEMNLSIRGRRFPGKTIDASEIRSIGFSIVWRHQARHSGDHPNLADVPLAPEFSYANRADHRLGCGQRAHQQNQLCGD